MDVERSQAIAGAAFVVNVGSRSGRKGLRVALSEFDRLGVRPQAVYDVRDAKTLVSATRDAIAQGRSLVIVGGGDGTATSVCGLFRNSASTLALIPLGTGNSFARSLGLPLNVRGAVEAIAMRASREIDLGIVNGIPFANYAAIGLSANVAGSTPARLKALFGPAAYVAIGFFATRRHRPFRCVIRVDDDTAARFDGSSHQIIIENGRYFGTAPLVPDATLNDGVLTTFAIAGAHRSAVIRFWLRMLGGANTRELPEGHCFSATRLRVETTPERDIEVDGQTLARTPAEFSVLRRAIRVLA